MGQRCFREANKRVERRLRVFGDAGRIRAADNEARPEGRKLPAVARYAALQGQVRFRPSALRRAIQKHLGFHFRFGLSLSVVNGTASLSFSSVQVLRASATISEQFSMCSKARLASSR